MEHNACPEASLATSQELERLVAARTQELQSQLDRAQAVYEHAPCGYLSIDADLRVVNINQTLKNWLGVVDFDLSRKPSVLHFVGPDSHDAVKSRVSDLRETGRCEPLGMSIRRVDGTPLHALLSSTAVTDAEGHFLYCNAMVQDTGALKAVESQLAKHVGFLQSITDRLPARLAYYDSNLNCRFANKAQAHRYGKTPAQMLGTPLSDVIRPEALPEILPRVADALSGNTQSFEIEREQKDGAHKVFLLNYLPDVQPSGVEGVFIEVQDITEHKRFEDCVLEANRDLEERVRENSAELFQSEQRYRLMVDAVQDHCIYFIDENGSVTDWTESAQRLHGHPRQQMLGRPYLGLLAVGNAGEDEVDPAQVLRLAKAHGQWETRGWRLRDDGSRFWAHTVLTALRNEAGELQGLSAITRDMTAAKSLEDVMNDLNKELEKRVAERTQQLVAANKDLDVFSHMVSHDLRAPLRHISSFVSLLQEQLGETSDRLTLQYLNSTAKASRRMSYMIEGLLEYARLGRVSIEAQPVPLAPLLQGVIEHLRMENPDRAIEWTVEEDLPVVRGDAMLLAQAFGNLLNNSVKYTRPRDTAKVEVGWKVNPVGGRTFYVHDNGVGFDLEKAHNLFVMFQRQHHSMDFEGTGTGLALSQRIIERHGGRIWAETAPGEGCTFYFTLPFEGAEPELEFPGSSMADLAF